jgi:hypothetical protein
VWCHMSTVRQVRESLKATSSDQVSLAQSHMFYFAQHNEQQHFI